MKKRAVECGSVGAEIITRVATSSRRFMARWRIWCSMVTCAQTDYYPK